MDNLPEDGEQGSQGVWIIRLALVLSGTVISRCMARISDQTMTRSQEVRAILTTQSEQGRAAFHLGVSTFLDLGRPVGTPQVATGNDGRGLARWLKVSWRQSTNLIDSHLHRSSWYTWTRRSSIRPSE